MYRNSSEHLIAHSGKTIYSQEAIYCGIFLAVAIRIWAT